jgi:O-antigen/teichoic acid export membrane protein
LASALLLANGLTVYAFGLLKIVQSAVSFASAFFLSGINNVVIAEASRATGEGRKASKASLLKAYCLLEFAIGVVLTLVLLVVAAAVASFRGAGWGLLFVSASPLVILGAVRMVAATLLQTEADFRGLTILRLSESILNLSVAAAAIVWAHGQVEILLLGYSLAQALAIAFVAGRFLPLVLASVRSRGDWSELILLVRGQGIWAIMNDYVKNFGDNAKLWILGGLAGLEAVEIFSLADALIGHTVSLFPLAQTLLPVVSRETVDESRMRRVFVRIIKYHLVVYLPLILVGLFVFPPFLHVFFPKYDSSIWLYRVMLLSLVPSAFGVALNIYLTAYRQQRSLFVLSVSRLVITLATVASLAPALGAFGAAIEYVVGAVYFAAVRMIILLKKMPFLSFRASELASVDDYDREMIGRVRIKVGKVLGYVRH